jgi:hypothetical protein
MPKKSPQSAINNPQSAIGDAELFPVLIKPQPITEPNRPFTGLFVWLAMSPRTDSGRADAAMSLTVQPYRHLADGTIDAAPESMKRAISVGSVLDLKADLHGDPALLAALDAILSALKTYLANG